jgi:hypothetical protein
MRPARIWACPKTRQYLGRCNDLEPLLRHQFYPGCIIATPGYDFQEGQALVAAGLGCACRKLIRGDIGGEVLCLSETHTRRYWW